MNKDDKKPVKKSTAKAAKSHLGGLETFAPKPKPPSKPNNNSEPSRKKK